MGDYCRLFFLKLANNIVRNVSFQDNALTVVVFKRNGNPSKEARNLWNLIGKYHSHYLPIRDILFGPAVPDSDVPRFFSVGEDRELVEYDLERRSDRKLHIFPRIAIITLLYRAI